jgi:peptidoglycan/xylan/chitin deacetylase (PgdA/CDA1 family)
MRELILNFHGLGDPPAHVSRAERNVWVPIAWLEAILEAMPRTGVRVTFDDGNKTDVGHALGALTRHRRVATFFVLAGELDLAHRVDASDVMRLSGAGMTIGSHGMHHVDWRRISPAELEWEITDSRRKLTEIADKDISEAAIPFGLYNRRVLNALRNGGYRRVYTSDGIPTSTGSWLAARTTVDRSRPLESWIQLAATGSATKLNRSRLLKQYVKRFR